MQHQMNLHNGPFAKIKSGSKTVEMRLYDERRRAITVGDTILFTNNTTGEQMIVEVTSLQTYSTFDKLYRYYDKVAIGYTEDQMADPQDMLQYYTKEQIATYGVVAIGIKLC